MGAQIVIQLLETLSGILQDNLENITAMELRFYCCSKHAYEGDKLHYITLKETS